MVTVSIVMSCLNEQDCIQDAVHSIIHQTFSDWELLIYDDGSTDATPQRLQQLRDPRIKVHYGTENQGLAARLNQGIQEACGRFIARMDADDIAYPERLLRQVTYLETHGNVDLVGTAALVFSGDYVPMGRFKVQLTHQEICQNIALGFPLAHPTWLGRREWFLRFPYQPQMQRAQDQDVLLRAYAASHFANLPDILLGYRQESPSYRSIVLGRWNYSRSLLQVSTDSLDTPFVLFAIRALTLQSLRGIIAVAFIFLGLGGQLLQRRFAPLTAADLDDWLTMIEPLTADKSLVD